jgi:hypothetical protein
MDIVPVGIFVMEHFQTPIAVALNNLLLAKPWMQVGLVQVIANVHKDFYVMC